MRFAAGLGVFGLLMVIGAAQAAQLESRPVSPICVAALLRNNEELAKLDRALSQGLSSAQLSRLEIYPGVEGFTRCLSPDAAYDTVVVIAHAALTGAGALGSEEKKSALVLPIDGQDTIFPSRLLKRWIEGSRANTIVIESCKTRWLEVRQTELGRDPRIHWVESESDPEGQTLSIEEAVEYLRRSDY